MSEFMRQAGLTHGGFYRHFDSRDELVAEAVAAALAHLILASLVGELLLARAVDDRGLSDEILARVARAVNGCVEDAQEA